MSAHQSELQGSQEPEQGLRGWETGSGAVGQWAPGARRLHGQQQLQPYGAGLSSPASSAAASCGAGGGVKASPRASPVPGAAPSVPSTSAVLVHGVQVPHGRPVATESLCLTFLLEVAAGIDRDQLHRRNFTRCLDGILMDLDLRVTN